MPSRHERYGVSIPPEYAGAFEAFVESVGGNITKRFPTRENVAQEWNKQASPARELVEKFEQEEDPQIRRGINNGVRRLIEDTFRMPGLESSRELINHLLCNILRSYLPLSAG